MDVEILPGNLVTQFQNGCGEFEGYTLIFGIFYI